jgi:hypothetical protein
VFFAGNLTAFLWIKWGIVLKLIGELFWNYLSNCFETNWGFSLKLDNDEIFVNSTNDVCINNNMGRCPKPRFILLCGQKNETKKRPPRRLFLNGLFQACPLNSKNSLRSDTFEFLTRSVLNHP